MPARRHCLNVKAEGVAYGAVQRADLEPASPLRRYPVRSLRRLAGGERREEEERAAMTPVEGVRDAEHGRAPWSYVGDVDLHAAVGAHLETVAHLARGHEARMTRAGPRETSDEQQGP